MGRSQIEVGGHERCITMLGATFSLDSGVAHLVAKVAAKVAVREGVAAVKGEEGRVIKYKAVKEEEGRVIEVVVVEKVVVSEVVEKEKSAHKCGIALALALLIGTGSLSVNAYIIN